MGRKRDVLCSLPTPSLAKYSPNFVLAPFSPKLHKEVEEGRGPRGGEGVNWVEGLVLGLSHIQFLSNVYGKIIVNQYFAIVFCLFIFINNSFKKLVVLFRDILETLTGCHSYPFTAEILSKI